ncbi:AAA family ATPase [Rhodococcus sp. NCIMB 12038]|uniref:AAA family ATPase n=1 Tax=Rhodococcus sp. NCIMB 12038 TaxID=933800 RepID=UPI000B3D04C6|nr:AAA family ATPase [Rhodococcus sp. NCIMB 12038]OUS97235.1 AAA family ATPase [Rhodococcus sp. NCIMB 12038]
MVEVTDSSREIDSTTYPMLAKYTAPLLPPVGRIIGREDEKLQVLASLSRPRLSNILLLAPAGSGKTVLVQDTMLSDPKRVYLEVDLARMNAAVGLADQMAGEIKGLFDEAENYALAEGRELVLFIDEFHQIVQMSPAAVEALKPVLAASGARGLKIIAATTFEEWIEYIRPNKPLDERLQRVNLTPAGREMTIEILRSFAEEAGVAGQFGPGDGLFGEIHDMTNRYMPSSVQPRKSIGILDGMIGWHRQTGEPMSMALMAKVMRQSTGVNLGFTIDGASIKAELDKKVYAQDLATTIISDQLQLVVAGLHDKKRPKGRFLLTGSTGVGKTELTKQLVDLLFADDLDRLIRFDMSEFALDSSMDLFRSELTKKVVSMGDAVILLDEIEKASRMVLRLMLQVLDDGRLSDDYGRQVSFLDCYIVLTTNAGSEVFNTISDYASDDTGSGEGLKDYMKSIENSIRSANDFPPELLGRLDRIVPFQPLSDATKRRILDRGLTELQNDVLSKHGVRLGVHPRVIEYLAIDVGEASADAGGARESMRALQGQIKVEVAKYINNHPKDKVLLLEIEGEMRAENLQLRKSKARPRVRAALRPR